MYIQNKCKPGTWANDIGFVLMELGENSSWMNDIPVDMSVMKYKLWDQFDQKWKHEVGSKPKLEFYATLNVNPHVPSAFVLSNIEKNKRSLIARLRNGSLHLKIEKGRFDRIPRIERLCDLCKNAIEDATHFLFDCPLFDNEWSTHNISKNNTIFDHPYKLGNFLNEIWKKRHTHLFKV